MPRPEAPGFFRVTRWAVDAMAWRERQGFAGGERSAKLGGAHGGEIWIDQAGDSTVAFRLPLDRTSRVAETGAR